MLTARVWGEGSGQGPLVSASEACPCCNARPGIREWKRLASAGDPKIGRTRVYATRAVAGKGGRLRSDESAGAFVGQPFG